MSESVSNNSESYYNPSRKYHDYSSSRNSESHYQGSSYDSREKYESISQPIEHKNNIIEKSAVNLDKSQTVVHKNETNIQKLEDLKKLLMETENFLVSFGTLKYPQVAPNNIRNVFRDMILSNEEKIKKFPDLNAIVEFYTEEYAQLSEKEQLFSTKKLLMEGLKELVSQKHKDNSKLKYW